MKEILAFLKTKTFWKHFGFALLALSLFLFILFKSLALYTNHNETITVPDFKGQSLFSLDKFVEDKEIRYEIIDSLYMPGEKPGVVVKQDPSPNTLVKHNRTIYLYVTSVMPPTVELPNLANGASLRQALSELESRGLKSKVKMVTGDCDGCVLKMTINGKEPDFNAKDNKGNPVRPRVKKGETVVLFVGEGESDARTIVPEIMGEKLSEGLKTLAASGLTQGGVITDGPSKDSLNMFIYKMEPPVGSSIRIGSNVILYITNDKSKIEQ